MILVLVTVALAAGSAIAHNATGRQSDAAKMEGCREMMGGGAPNEQWRSPEQNR